MRKIQRTKLVGIPLVMHGGSGIDREGYERSISFGIRKINYYTYMAKAAAEYIVRNENDYHFYHDIVMDAIKIMKENSRNAMSIFSMRSPLI